MIHLFLCFSPRVPCAIHRQVIPPQDEAQAAESDLDRGGVAEVLAQTTSTLLRCTEDK